VEKTTTKKRKGVFECDGAVGAKSETKKSFEDGFGGKKIRWYLIAKSVEDFDVLLELTDEG